MKRQIETEFMAWKARTNRMPLLLDGARQVGKTYALNAFGRNAYRNVVYANFEQEKSLSAYFDGDIIPARLIQYLEVHYGQRIIPGETLIILDEIHASGRALISLKYFAEQAPQYHVVAAGSLLGVAISHGDASFPVGKVEELTMHPMNFEEYLWALGKKPLADLILEHFLSDAALPIALHEEALRLHKMFLVTGGMPAVVSRFVETSSLLMIPEIQDRILNDYVADMAKYAKNAEAVKIRACFQSIPAQLAKDNAKFQYKTVQRGGTATIFGAAIEWLVQAGIVLKCQRIEQGLAPLAARVDPASFKLYMGDVGLLTKHSGMAQSTILSPLSETNDFLGRLAENDVAQIFAGKGYPLYYWKNEGQGELDFVLQRDDQIVPVEVKKGVHTRSVSLEMFMAAFHCPKAIRVSQKNFGNDGRIKAVPLYAAHCI